MNFNFFFISYTVIYAKYNHCYEIPRDLPKRYFDGKEWKFMKPRNIFRTKAPRYSNISTELDWADLIKEIKEIELQDPTTPMPPACGRTKTSTQMSPTCCRAKTTTKTKFKTTTKTKFKTTTKTTTREKTTTKKITTKMTTPKTTIRKFRPLTKPTTTKKAAVKHSLSPCKLKLKTITTTTIDPRIWQMKMRTSEDWINIWTRVRPTKKPSQVTARKYTTKNLPATKTKKPVTTTKAPVTTTMKPVTTTEKSVKLSGIQRDDGNGPENWSNLMREFLKFVELKKCRPPCEYGTTTTMPFSGYMLGDKRIRSGADDLTNILLDGVEIDNKLSEVDDDASQSNTLMRFRETYEADRGQRFNYDSVEGSFSRDSKINDNVQDLDLKSFKDSVKISRIKQDEETTQYSNKNSLLKESNSKNVKQDYETPRISRLKAYLDEFKVRNAIKEDEIIQDSEINSYISMLKDKHTIKEKDSETEAYSDAENARYTEKAHDTDIRKRLNAIKDMYTQRYKDNSQYVSKDPLNFKKFNEIEDYEATKRTYSTEIRNDNEDYLQNRDLTFDLGTLEDDHEKADTYSTEIIEEPDSDAYAYADTVNDINELKDDKTISYENVIPLFKFKYALNENITQRKNENRDNEENQYLFG